MDSKRVLDWMKDPNRKPANLAFTAGDERQAAYLIEEAERSLRERNKELLQVLHDMTGILIMGKAFTDMHREAIQSAKKALQSLRKDKCAACGSTIQTDGNSLCDSCRDEISSGHV